MRLIIKQINKLHELQASHDHFIMVEGQAPAHYKNNGFGTGEGIFWF